MRILLTGVSGQVGGALQVLLSGLGSVVAADRSQLDLSQPDTISAVLDQLRPDLIVNPAAYTAVDLAEDERDLAFRVNADAPAAMASWGARHDVPIIHFSTDYLFDGSGDVPWRETDRPSPLSVYGASKLAGERALGEAGGRHLIVRTSWVYASQGRNFLRTIARLARERKELKIVADQFGAPTSAQIISEAVVKILREELSGGGKPFERNGGAVNVSASGTTSWHGFASAIVTGLQQRGVDVVAEQVLPICTADFPTKAARPANSRLDHDRLNHVFGVTMPTWQQALAVELDDLAPELVAASRDLKTPLAS
ncbi:dTDP-4-dehydrorhamnose reductase [Bradyrhizobium prioriisuperbiae]|uniref:dTDP-4-dehydrorhamnose reductase n=1 Tax=Bradyrhizobium prioriisuperbiae TaxID=2854389 RepID=UPI0028E2D268|nr:dTDP-4-dehydrorhamnose reductase [Bradyrhizobium prioritasuperba]